MKKCTKCQIEMSIDNFYKGNGTDGFSHWCKSCITKYQKSRSKEIKKYVKNNKVNVAKSQRRYSLKPTGIYRGLKSHNERRSYEFNIDKDDFIKWYNKQKQQCHYCNRTLGEVQTDTREKEQNKTRLSIDRKDNSLGYILDNIVLACRRCNYIKGDYFTEKEMIEIGKTLYRKEIKNV